ncbi:MAG: hypothetical protein WCE79_15180 [Xanthobacteraceae bacterium]
MRYIVAPVGPTMTRAQNLERSFFKGQSLLLSNHASAALRTISIRFLTPSTEA